MASVRIGSRISIYASKIAKGNNGVNPSWRGYCWGSDWPKMSFQNSGAVYCLDIFWLCYFTSIYWNKRFNDCKVEEPGNG